jgi:hypothetical protein
MARVLGLSLLACVSIGILAAGEPPEAPAQDLGCQGDFTGAFPDPEPAALRFGVYPGGRAGAVIGAPQTAKPNRPGRIRDALERLAGNRPFFAHLYLEFTGLEEQRARVLKARALIRRFQRQGTRVEYVLAYRPAARRGVADATAFAKFVERFVRRFGDEPGLRGVQVTNEVNNSLSPDASDGAYPAARTALVEGVLAARRAIRATNANLHLGFNWFYRLDPRSDTEFWSGIGDLGGQRFADAVDWVGVDVYPGTYFPPAPVPRDDSVLNAVSYTRECMMPLAGLGDEVEIHVTENGWPTGPGRPEAEQAEALAEMVEAAHAYAGEYGVSDYRWFALRDADTSSLDFQQHYGLMRDDYSTKPAFDRYAALIRSFSVGPRRPDRRPERQR